MAATLEAFGEQIAANAPLAPHRPARRHGRRRHLPFLTGGGLPHRRHHPGGRGHRHHPLARSTAGPITRTPSLDRGNPPCCCCTRCTGSPGPRRTRSTTPTATSTSRRWPSRTGAAALVPAAGPWERAGLHGRHHHGLPRRGGMGGAGRARPRAATWPSGRPRSTPCATATHGQDRPAGAVVPAAGDRLRHGAGRGRDPQELALHGGHRLALRRRAAGLPRQGGHAVRPHAEQPEGGGHRA